MNRKVFSYLVFSVFVILPAVSQANIEISEIMYDPAGADSGREWVEIHNPDSTAVDIASWKFLESSGASNHGLTLIQGVSNIGPNEYAVIVIDSTKFLSDWPAFTGNILKASFSSLNNSGSTIIIKDEAGNIIDQYTYASSQGAGGDGNSLQKAGGVWKTLSPTPASGASAATNNSTTDNSGNATTSNSQTTINTQTPPKYGDPIVSTHYVSNDISQTPTDESGALLSVSAGRNRLVAVGSPIQFRANASGGALRNGAEYKWSLGDGFVAYGESIEHMYSFAGDYVVVLTVSSAGNVAVHRISVRVVNPNLSVRHVTGGIEIKNNGKDEINLFKWEISAGDATYTVPSDLIVMPGKFVVLDALISKLPDGGEIAITNAEGKEVNLSSYAENSSIIKKANQTSQNISKVIKPEDSNLAAVGNTLVIEHNKGFLNRIGEFLVQLFSSP
ncbi:MAG: lamin tail domain-containing protein [Minisyncoccia bacterium]